MFWRLRNFLSPYFERNVVLASNGHCFTCGESVRFVSKQSWLRDHFRCQRCGSIPRQRALMAVIEEWFPNWRELRIHESSPGGRGASARLRRECKDYKATQYFPDVEPGTIYNGHQCEDLRDLTFQDASYDLHITQDVLEHVFEHEKVFAELARTLRPGGAHICTVPLVSKRNPSKLRASLVHGEVVYHEEPDYHGNPVSKEGSLVVTEWGYDICESIFNASGLYTQIIKIDDLSLGIRAEYNEVLVSLKK